MCLEFFGINILSIREHNYIFAAAGDGESSFWVNEAEISRAQPAVVYRFSSLIRRAVIALHQHRTADPDFTHALSIWRIDADGYAAKRFSNSADVIVTNRRDRCSSRCFC